MRPDTPIRLIKPNIDAYSKSISRPYAEFDVQGLGIKEIEGFNIQNSPPVRLPGSIEPGALLDLHVGFNGGVEASEIEKDLTSLFETPRVIITDLMTVQLLNE